MQTLFDKFDRDGGGTIDVHELGDALREMGKEPTPGDLATLMKEADRDGSGQLSFEEFCGILGKKVASADVEVLLEAFKVFDKDGSGKLDRSEVFAIFQNLGTNSFRPPNNAELNRLMTEADVDGDGLISCEEFVKSLVATSTL